MNARTVQKLRFIFGSIHVVGNPCHEYSVVARRRGRHDGVYIAQGRIRTCKARHHLFINAVGWVAVPACHLCHGGRHGQGFAGSFGQDCKRNIAAEKKLKLLRIGISPHFKASTGQGTNVINGNEVGKVVVDDFNARNLKTENNFPSLAENLLCLK